MAQRDAFTVERLRRAGAICLGKTNMPPMANGGMQRGVYGRAESPYNADYLTAPLPPALQRCRYCHRRQLLCLWSGGRDLVERPGPCVQQRPSVLYTVPWRDFRCAATGR